MIKALKKFQDKETRKIYQVGAVIDLGKERNESAVKRGLAEWVEKEAAEKEGKPATTKKEKK